jgi:ribosomal protein S8
MKVLSSTREFFLLLRYCVKNDYNVFTFAIQRTSFKEVISVIQSLQRFHFILRFRENKNFSLSVFLSCDLEASLCVKKVIVLAKNQGVISSKLFKKFAKEDSLGIIFVRTQEGILTLKEAIKSPCGGQMLALVK